MSTDRQEDQSRIFSMAAYELDSSAATAADISPASQLLETLGYTNIAGHERCHAARLLRFAGEHCDVFEVNADAEGTMVFLGAVPNARTCQRLGATANFSGAGLTMRKAFEACIGEAIEHISHVLFSNHVDQASDLNLGDLSPTQASTLQAWLDEAATHGPVSFDTVSARRLSDQSLCHVPRCLMLRSMGAGAIGADWFAWSSGCAAAPTLEEACLSGLREVLERDAVALWWCGGNPGRPVDLESILAADETCATLLLDLLRDQADVVRMYDMTTEFAVPCMVAMACRPDGTHAVFGFACHENPARACANALRELHQMRVGRRLLFEKRSAVGETGLDTWETSLMARLENLNFWKSEAACAAHGTAMHQIDLSVVPNPDLVGKLTEHGFEAFVLDLTNASIGVPVAKVLVPGLQPYPSRHLTKRLRTAQSRACMPLHGETNWFVL